MIKNRLMPGSLSMARLTQKKLANIAFVLFYSIDLLRMLFSFVLGISFSSPIAVILSTIVAYIPLFLLFLLFPKTKKIDSILLLLGVCIFFLFTYLLHPEYEYWYAREGHGAWDYVLRPNNGIYIYVFVRTINDPEEIKKCLKPVALISLLFNGLRFFQAFQRGYWIVNDSSGIARQMSYNLTAGYELLFPTIIFLFFFFDEKKKRYFLLACVGLILILTGGSRGPLISLFIFLSIIFLRKTEFRGKVFWISLGALLALLFFLIGYRQIAEFILGLLERMSIRSRTLQMMLTGEISNENGRERIYAAAIEMIKQRPILGYGAMGDRHIISAIHYVGHCHNFFLEIMVNIGVVLGLPLIAFLFYHAVRIIVFSKDREWSDVFIIFFCTSCQLLTSLTFWHVDAPWAALAVGVCYYAAVKKNKRVKREERLNGYVGIENQ